MTETVYHTYVAALRDGDRRRALKVAQSALNEGIDIRDLYMEVFQPAMHEIGRLWEVNEITVAQEHLATAITQSVMAQLYAYVFARPPVGRTLVATCIGGELHELGIRMIADFFEIEGWDVYYLGANMPEEDVVNMVNDQQADLLAISVTLNNHVPHARNLIQAVRASPIGSAIKTMVGGQPINRSPDICNVIGADLTALNARDAVQSAREVLG
jgi:MerR family transcriptional regulator, light-induced transcriptional regulator